MSEVFLQQLPGFCLSSLFPIVPSECCSKLAHVVFPSASLAVGVRNIHLSQGSAAVSIPHLSRMSFCRPISPHACLQLWLPTAISCVRLAFASSELRLPLLSLLLFSSSFYPSNIRLFRQPSSAHHAPQHVPLHGLKLLPLLDC